MKKIILIGGGGHCKSCIDVIEQEAKYEIVGIIDSEQLLGQNLLGYKFIGTDDDIKRFVQLGYYFLITVGQIKTSSIRRKIANILQVQGAKLAVIISPRAYVSRHVQIEGGTIVMHDALINTHARVGGHCIVNTKALIEHDVFVESFCHISTAAVINGGVTLREGTFFGSNAVSRESITIKSEDFIRAGQVVK